MSQLYSSLPALAFSSWLPSPGGFSIAIGITILQIWWRLLRSVPILFKGKKLDVIMPEDLLTI